MMYSQLDYEARIARYAKRNARINADGWRRPIPARRARRAAGAATLMALAARLAPAAARPAGAPQPRTTTAA